MAAWMADAIATDVAERIGNALTLVSVPLTTGSLSQTDDRSESNRRVRILAAEARGALARVRGQGPVSDL